MEYKSLQLNGQNARKDRRELDFYPTPPECTVALLKFLEEQYILTKGNLIWEPACGELKSMSKVLEFSDYEVISTDLIFGNDFLSYESAPGKVDAIITNPPFNKSEDFIKQGLKLSPVTCLLLKSQYFHAKARLKIFEENPPSWILPLTWRPDFLFHERTKQSKSASPTMEVLWACWTTECFGFTKYQPLPKPTMFA